MAYDNNMRGSLFKNQKKVSSSHPDYTGSAEIDGKEYWISGWIKESGITSKNPGTKFFSIAFKAKEEDKTAEHKASHPSNQKILANIDFDDDVPF